MNSCHNCLFVMVYFYVFSFGWHMVNSLCACQAPHLWVSVICQILEYYIQLAIGNRIYQIILFTCQFVTHCNARYMIHGTCITDMYFCYHVARLYVAINA